MASAATVESNCDRARAFHRRAQRLLAEDVIESRRRARAELVQATLLCPDEPRYHIALGQLYAAGGFTREARKCYEQALEIDPKQDRAHWGLGELWRSDWLRTLDEASRDRAITAYGKAANSGPALVERWIRLAPLLVERGELRAAQAAAELAFEAKPRDPEALVAVAYTAFLLGNLERADIGFKSAVPRLEPGVRRLFENVQPIVPPEVMRRLDRLDGKAREAGLSAFWKEMDPDLTTPMNEARLEFWSRVAHAYFLYFDPKWQSWDLRGQLYVRYGAPRWRDFNPPRSPEQNVSNWQVWTYPDLGMRIWLQDQARNGRYQQPGMPLSFYSADQPIPMLPFPDSLARRPDLMTTTGAVGTFHRLPPGAAALDVRAAVWQFVGGAGPRLLAQAQVPGSPANELTAEWTVFDSTWNEVAHAVQVMAASACDPAELRVVDFAADLTPGDYRVAVSVRGERGARAAFKTDLELRSTPAGLDLSDIVVQCGPPMRPVPGEGPAVRLAPNLEGRVPHGGTLAAYFEIYGLTAGPDLRSRFEYLATVRSAERDDRGWIRKMFAPRAMSQEIAASREEESLGALRRQFFSVPLQSLPPGRYRLEIRVKDLIGGGEVQRAAAFVIG